MADIQSILKEERVFPPPRQFAASARLGDPVAYQALCARAEADPEGFWAELAAELHWFAPWERVLDWRPPWARWFVGGKTNLSYNCLDRHLATRGGKAAPRRGCGTAT